MKNDDVERIQRVLAGDENAFSTLKRSNKLFCSVN